MSTDAREAALGRLRETFGEASVRVGSKNPGRFLDVDLVNDPLAGQRPQFADPPEPAESVGEYCDGVRASVAASGDELAPPLCYDLDQERFTPLNFTVHGAGVGVSPQGYGAVSLASASPAFIETLVMQGRRARTLALAAAQFGGEFADGAAHGSRFLVVAYSPAAGAFPAGSYSERKEAEADAARLGSGGMLLLDLHDAAPALIPLVRNNGSVRALTDLALPLCATDADIAATLAETSVPAS